jgi:phospholipase C
MLRAARVAPLAAAGIQLLAACAANPPAATGPAGAQRDSGSRDSVPGLDRLQHVVVIYLENHSFDNLYGEFPGAAGLASAATRAAQVDESSRPYTTLPRPPGTAFPATLPNAPFSIEQYVPADRNTPDLIHRFYQEQLQIDGGKMDRFAVVSDAKGLVMGFYHTAALPLAREAAQYTLCDNFFHAAFGGSFLNHIWLVAARSPVFPDAPDTMVARLDQGGHLLRDEAVTPDGYVVNTAFTVNSPHPPSIPRDRLLPSQTFATIGDRLSAKGITWSWYSGGWNDALTGHPAPLFQFHHQPFAYFANYADGRPARAEHLKDEAEFFAAARAGALPAVSFVKPLGEVNEHPGYSNVLSGERHALDLIQAVRSGPAWARTAIIVTYDENGGFWDHVPPPVTDRWGPGTRVPTLIISPFARRGYVDHTLYDTTSILAFLERRWQLESLTDRDAHANDLTNAFDFGPSGGRGSR